MPTFDLTPLLPHVVAAATLVELVALGALTYLLGRARAERRAAEGAVEALRADLGRLLEEAESRARALEDALAARETSLRALLARVEGGSRRCPEEDDPAEARLLRDLDLRIGRGRIVGWPCGRGCRRGRSCRPRRSGFAAAGVLGPWHLPCSPAPGENAHDRRRLHRRLRRHGGARAARGRRAQPRQRQHRGLQGRAPRLPAAAGRPATARGAAADDRGGAGRAGRHGLRLLDRADPGDREPPRRGDPGARVLRRAHRRGRALHPPGHLPARPRGLPRHGERRARAGRERRPPAAARGGRDRRERRDPRRRDRGRATQARALPRPAAARAPGRRALRAQAGDDGHPGPRGPGARARHRRRGEGGMIRALYTAATGMQAQQLSIDVIANNLANVNTTGLKKSRADFEDLLYQMQPAPGTPSTTTTESPTGVQVGLGARPAAVSRLDLQGDYTQTGNPLDVAIEGPGLFQVTLPDGTLAYTRAGSFQIDNQLRVVTPDGYPLSPAISIPNSATNITIGQDGTVSAILPGQTAATQIGQIQTAFFANPAGLRALGRNLLQQTDSSGPPQLGAPGQNNLGTLLQGFLENSNVSVVEELVGLITAQRAYEVTSKAIQTADQMLQTTNAIVQ